MSIAAGIALIVFGAILTFALKGGHIGNLDLHAVGVILILAGVIGILLPALIRNRSRFSRPTIRSRQDVMDDGTRTIVNHTDGSQTLVEHNDGEQTFAEHFNRRVSGIALTASTPSTIPAAVRVIAVTYPSARIIPPHISRIRDSGPRH
jgi:hypothetical protein